MDAETKAHDAILSWCRSVGGAKMRVRERSEFPYRIYPVQAWVCNETTEIARGRSWTEIAETLGLDSNGES